MNELQRIFDVRLRLVKISSRGTKMKRHQKCRSELDEFHYLFGACPTSTNRRTHNSSGWQKGKHLPPPLLTSPSWLPLCVCLCESQQFAHRSLSCSLPSRATAPTSDISRVQYNRTSVFETTANPRVCVSVCVSVSVTKKLSNHMVFLGDRDE